MPDGDVVGMGTHGVVTKGRSRLTGALRAIKTVQKKQVRDIIEFKKEIWAMTMMDHPNIVKLFETFEDSRRLYLVMELCRGGELFSRILEKGTFTEAEAIVVMRQILRAVCYLHEMNIAHRDLKPENFLFEDEGPVEESVLKLIDFGLSCHELPGEFHKEVVGTPQYVAPQVLLHRYDKRCDIWSCGVIMYTLLSGRPAFTGNTDQEVLAKVRRGIVHLSDDPWKAISPEAKQLLRMLLRRNPIERITAEQALAHPWLRAGDGEGGDSGALPGLHAGVFERLREFSGQSRLKKAALHAIADQLTSSETKNIRKVFDSLDTSGVGVLTIRELRMGFERARLGGGGGGEGGEAFLSADLEELLLGLDLSSSGVIDFTEFLAASLDLETQASDEACWSAFNVFGLDGDGCIAEKELLMPGSGCCFQSEGASTATGGAGGGAGSGSFYPSERSLGSLDSEVRSNGRLGFQDFVALARSGSSL